jgi:hypothetical protein
MLHEPYFVTQHVFSQRAVLHRTRPLRGNLRCGERVTPAVTKGGSERNIPSSRSNSNVITTHCLQRTVVCDVTAAHESDMAGRMAKIWGFHSCEHSDCDAASDSSETPFGAYTRLSFCAGYSVLLESLWLYNRGYQTVGRPRRALLIHWGRANCLCEGYIYFERNTSAT